MRDFPQFPFGLLLIEPRKKRLGWLGYIGDCTAQYCWTIGRFPMELVPRNQLFGSEP